MSVPIPSVNAERLWRALEEISQFGITPASGLHRLAASVEDGEARDYFVAAAQALGCTVRIDAVGNTLRSSSRHEPGSTGHPHRVTP